MKHLKRALICCVVITLLSGCSNVKRQDAGMVAGGAAGAVIGHAVTGGSAVGTGVGAVGGAVVGRKLAE